ncbi:hypothetical protein ACFX2I_011091 [Malus domestica]
MLLFFETFPVILVDRDGIVRVDVPFRRAECKYNVEQVIVTDEFYGTNSTDGHQAGQAWPDTQPVWLGNWLSPSSYSHSRAKRKKSMHLKNPRGNTNPSQEFATKKRVRIYLLQDIVYPDIDLETPMSTTHPFSNFCSGPHRFLGAFRDNVLEFVQEFDNLGEFLHGMNVWRRQLTVEGQGVTVPLYIIEEDVKKLSKRQTCDHCRITGDTNYGPPLHH